MNDRSIRESQERAMWRAYRAELLAFTRRRLHDDGAAEDLVQDVLTKGYSQRERLRDKTRLRAWLYQVTRNAIIDHYRRDRPTEDIPDDLADAGEETGDVEEALVRCLVPSLQRLPEAYREAVVLSELEGMRQKDVATRLGLTLSGAKSRVQRGRGLLREMLITCCDIRLDVRGALMDYHCKRGCGCC